MSKKEKKSPFLASIKSKPWLWVAVLGAIVLIVWPLFFITELKQYPTCLAYDLFPVGSGYPSDANYSFLLLIHLPSVLAGVFILSIVTTLLRKSTIIWSYLLKTALFYAVTIFVLCLLVALFTFNITSDKCFGYRSNQLPDLNLFIDSRR
jgi:hypothetical protein